VVSFVYIFYPDEKKTSLQEFWDGELSNFLVSLYKNGQLIKQQWNLFEECGTLRLNCIAPDQDSLDQNYYNQYCKNDFSRLVELSAREPQCKLIGHVIGPTDSCTCSDPSYYILFTTFLAENSSPISYGDCNLPVPLYKLPVINKEKDYGSVLYWKEIYQCCDTLFILSDIGERFGYKQLSNINSPLSFQGIDICKKMSWIRSLQRVPKWYPLLIQSETTKWSFFFLRS